MAILTAKPSDSHLFSFRSYTERGIIRLTPQGPTDSKRSVSALSVEAGAPEGLTKDLRSKGTRSMSIEVDIDRVTPDIKPSPGRGVVDRRRYPKNLAPSGISEP